MLDWERNGLPTNGTGEQLAKIKIKELEDVETLIRNQE